MKNEKLISILKTNLSLQKGPSKKPLKSVSVIVLTALAVFFILKFTFLDRHRKLHETEAMLQDILERTQTINSACLDWDQVEDKYNTYFGDYSANTNNTDVLSLLEQQIFPVCTVKEMSLSGQKLYLVMEGLTLDGISQLITKLKEDDLVKLVSVSSYMSQDVYGNTVTTTNMTITLSNGSPPHKEGENISP